MNSSSPAQDFHARERRLWRPRIVLCNSFQHITRNSTGAETGVVLTQLAKFIDFVTVNPSGEFSDDGNSNGIGIDGFLYNGKEPENRLNVAMESEQHLQERGVFNRYMTRVFTHAEFRERFLSADNTAQPGALIDFHSRNKYLLMLYNYRLQKEMGRVVALHKGRSWADIVVSYHKLLNQAFSNVPGPGQIHNVLQHLAGYFKDQTPKREKLRFQRILGEILGEATSPAIGLDIIRNWTIRYQSGYLSRQTLFNPYPEGLEKRAYPFG